MQVTPARELCWLLPGLAFGVTTMDQSLPFHCSASVVWASETPTAQQSAALTHTTPLRLVSPDRLGLGVVTIDQTLPFQCSAREKMPLLPLPT